MKRNKPQNKELYKIGEIAKAVGILPSQVRFYTKIGLLREDSRTQGNYRLYRKRETIGRLREILRLKEKGFSLDEIAGRVGSGKEPGMKMEVLSGLFAEYDVKFAYLFGSAARGDTSKLSDVDIAVYLDDNLNSDRRFDIRLELISKAVGILERDDVDLVVLNDVDNTLAYNVIYAGKLLYCVDDLKRIRYEARIMSVYFDQHYYFKRHARLTIDRIAREGIL